MNTRALNILAAFTFIASSLLVPGLSLAQDTTERVEPNHQGWYQVEMIIFSRNNPSLQEHFPSNIHLGYPPKWQVLKDPNPTVNQPPTDTQINLDPINSTITTIDEENNIEIDFNSQPFYLLPIELRQLNAAANRLSASAEYNVLFHQAWRQPIGSQQQADWILINNSRTEEDAPLLSGSIRLSVATYLRLDTRLWFAEFEPKLDATPNIWPEIPESPDQLLKEIDASKSAFFADQSIEAPSNESPAISETIQTKRVILLKEKRQMRSNQANYIDHPILGIIITISPFTPTTANETATTNPL